MSIAIIGSGNVGAALASQFARSGIPVVIANTRGPESMSALFQDLAEFVKPVSLKEALRASVIILAVPFRAHSVVAEAATDWHNKIIIDAMNTYGVSPEELQGHASSDLVAKAFPGASVVKSLNQLPAKLLARDPAEDGGRRVMFVAGNDQVASASVAKLVADLGFAPINLGTIAEGGALLGMGGPLILQNLIKLH